MKWKKTARKIQRGISVYWFPLSAGFITAGIMVLVEAGSRGEIAMGGEIMVPIFFCVIHSFLRGWIREKKAKRTRKYGSFEIYSRDARIASGE